MKKILLLGLAIALTSPCVAMAQHAGHGAATTQSPVAARSVAAPKLQAALRGLWRDHVARTRDYAFAVQANRAAAAKSAESAVVANAKQISDAVAGFYGKAAGDQMLTLLAGHWTAVKQMTDASKKGDTAANTRAVESLTRNAKDIAEFLSAANPNLPKDAVFGLLVAHGGHHAAQIAQIMAGNLKGEKTTYAAMQTHMDTIADALAQALVKQFPNKAA